MRLLQPFSKSELIVGQRPPVREALCGAARKLGAKRSGCAKRFGVRRPSAALAEGPRNRRQPSQLEERSLQASLIHQGLARDESAPQKRRGAAALQSAGAHAERPQHVFGTPSATTSLTRTPGAHAERPQRVLGVREALCAALLLVLCLFAFPAAMQADEASVSAALSSAAASVGEAVELQLVASGANISSWPEVRVDGLNVLGVADSSNISIVNGAMSRSVTRTYTIAPQHAGTFTIPSLTVDASGKKLATQPLTLTVSGQGQSAQQPNAAPGQPSAQAVPGNPASPSQFAFAEWVLPKNTGYVGEAIPAELRLYVDAQVRWQIQQMPSASGDGFTLQKFPQPRKNTVQRDGRNYDLLIFKTALIPVKAGKLTLPATDVNFIAVLPQKRQRRPSMPRMPGFPDIFNDPFFDNTFNVQQQVKAPTAPVELDIKPLPISGRPKHFSGAVGTFTMKTGASPTRVKAGDPITVTCSVSGIGSFDRMEAPYIAEEPGWRAYPPSNKFTPNEQNEAGISGMKAFEIALIADSARDRLPKIEFSYFDPNAEKYVTLTDESNLVTVEGSATPPPTVASQPNAVATAAPAATSQPKVSDIFYIQTESRNWGAVFEPVWQTRFFWLAQLAPLAALVALGGWRIRQARLGDKRARRAASLREARAEVLKAIRQQPMNPGEFYDSVVRFLQIDTALSTAALKADREPATVDAEAACSVRALDGETAADVRRLFAAHDEFRYAGSGGNGETISPERRESVLRTLDRLEKSHA